MYGFGYLVKHFLSIPPPGSFLASDDFLAKPRMDTLRSLTGLQRSRGCLLKKLFSLEKPQHDNELVAQALLRPAVPLPEGDIGFDLCPGPMQSGSSVVPLNCT